MVKSTRTKNKQYEKALVINDIHIPFEDKKALKVTLAVADVFNPDIVFLNGDVMDCWQISRYVKNPKLHTQANLLREIKQTRIFLEGLCAKFPTARKVWIFGNHEYRFASYIIQNAIELHGLKGMTLGEQIGVDDLNIEVIDSGNKENSFMWGKLLIGHFDRVCAHSGATARALVESKAISLMQAHVHRGGSFYRRLYDRDIVGYENFCLCSRDPDYVDRPNWQLGFSTVVNDGSRFHVTQHPIIVDEDGNRYTTWFNGQEFNA